MLKKASKAFFFEKKKQKTFASCRVLTGEGRDSGVKSVLVLFFKKGLLALPCLPATAHAHAFLDHAQPRVGSTIQAAPTEVVLTFTQAVEPAFSRIEVSDAQGVQEAGGPVHGDATILAVPLRPLAAGTYTVRWHVTSVDTHKTQGKFVFTVGR